MKSKKQSAGVLILLAGGLLLLFTKEVKTEIANALALSVETVIPGLFPFLILCETAAEAGMLQPNNPKIQSAFTHLLHLSPACAPAVLFGLTGGYLTGVKTAVALYQKHTITQREAQRLCLFTVSPGLAFAVSAVGTGLLGHTAAGWLLFASCTLAALLLGIFAAGKSQIQTKTLPPVQPLPIAVVFTQAVQKSASACLALSAWMAVFAAIKAAVFPLLPQAAQPFFVLLAEVTTGCIQGISYRSLPLCAAVLGFGGLCIFCQLLPDLQALELSSLVFLRYRLLQAGLSACFCKLGLFLFPTADFSLQTMLMHPYSINPTASVFLLLACYIFILDLAPRKKTWYTEGGR